MAKRCNPELEIESRERETSMARYKVPKKRFIHSLKVPDVFLHDSLPALGVEHNAIYQHSFPQ